MAGIRSAIVLRPESLLSMRTLLLPRRGVLQSQGRPTVCSASHSQARAPDGFAVVLSELLHTGRHSVSYTGGEPT